VIYHNYKKYCFICCFGGRILEQVENILLQMMQLMSFKSFIYHTSEKSRTIKAVTRPITAAEIQAENEYFEDQRQW
jgi:hypothetical protein